MKKFVTLLIISYKSSDNIKLILKKFSKSFKIIIVDNSKDIQLKKLINKKNKNINLYFQNNVGYGAAINFGSKYVKTNYFFAFNPDLNFNISCIRNLYKAAKKLKGKFGALGYRQSFINKKNKTTELTKSINGSGMFFFKDTFNKIGGFDKNIWLFFEENDFCKRATKLNYPLYSINNAVAYHTGGDSMNSSSPEEKKFNMILVKSWHGLWSRYYFYKKHYGFIYAFKNMVPRLIKIIVQLLITSIYNIKKTRIYYFQLYGVVCSIIGTKSFLRPKK